MGQSHNLSPQFGPADVWYKSSPTGHTTYAYERGSRKQVGQLQTFPKGWGAKEADAGVHYVEVDEARRGQGIATGMYAKYHDRNPESVLEHDEFTMSSHAMRMMPKLAETFPGKHVFTSRQPHER